MRSVFSKIQLKSIKAYNVTKCAKVLKDINNFSRLCEDRDVTI